MKTFFVSQRHTQDIHGTWTDSLENTYLEYFSKFGIILFPVSNICENLPALFEQLKPEGIILTGGGDVDPELYGGENLTNLSISKERDQIEKKLLEIAIQKNIHVLGICRGMQFINVFFGGKLIQNISKIDNAQTHTTPGIHNITINNDNLISLGGNKTEYSVNSYHNLGVLTNMLGNNLNPFAIFEPLNLVEGLFHTKYPIAAVEWHPERTKPSDELDKILIKAFLQNELFWKINQ